MQLPNSHHTIKIRQHQSAHLHNVDSVDSVDSVDMCAGDKRQCPNQ